VSPERFVLDAVVRSVINEKAFRAELGNGHEIVAFRGCAGGPAPRRKPGDRVQVEMSPCDMSKGRILEKDSEDCHESA
jgi:translation initiation factor IF-1